MPKYPVSDHCNGSTFFNPSNPDGNSLLDVAKMLLTSKFKEWPERIENHPALHLDSKLALDEVAVTFVNHATVLAQTRSFNFLTDPVWSDRVSPLTWIGPKRHRDPGIPFERLPRIDFVVISHNHYDHMDISTLKRLNEAYHPQFFVPLGNKPLLEENGVKNIVEMDWWEVVNVSSDVSVSLAPAEHFSGRGPFDRNETLWGSYLVQFGQHSIYFAGDTAYSTHFKAIRERFGSPDISFLPIGAYDPRWFMKVVHMNPEEAVQAHLDLAAKQSIGIHFGTFQLTEESLDQPVKDLDAALNGKKIQKDEFITVDEGKTCIFKINKVKIRAFSRQS